MERVYQAVKAFLLEAVNPLLPEYEDEGARLPPLTEETIVFGALDPARLPAGTVCAVFPESLEEAAESIDGEGAVRAEATVTFLCSGAPYPELIARACRYALCLRRAVRDDWTLGASAQDAQVKRVNFFPDCGVTEKQASASEAELTIIMTEE